MRCTLRLAGLAGALCAALALPLSAATQTRVQPTRAPSVWVDVAQYQALRHLLRSGDVVYALCSRPTPPGALRRGARHDPTWDREWAVAQLRALRAVNTPGVQKSVVLSSVDDLNRLRDDWPRDARWAEYHLAPGYTPEAELLTFSRSVNQFARLARARDLKVGWWPAAEIVDLHEASVLPLARGVDRFGLQLRSPEKEEHWPLFALRARERVQRLRAANPRLDLLLDAGVDVQTHGKGAQALAETLALVDGVSSWPAGDGAGLRTLLSYLRR